LYFEKNAIFSPKIGKNRRKFDHNIDPRSDFMKKLEGRATKQF
jgi:hypothetical protein